jgi:flagellar basal body-associated protein FliL
VPEQPIEEQEVTPPAMGGLSIGKILMIVVLALLTSAGGGVVSFVLISRTLNAQAKAPDVDRSREAEQEKIAAMLQKSAVLPLEPFVVNLADTDAA